MTIIYGMKRCPGTRAQPQHLLEGSPGNFAMNLSRPDGQAVYCRTCACQKQKEWRDRNPLKKKASRKTYYARTGK